MSTQPKTKPLPTEWQVSDASELYRIPSWGDPFFFVNEKGHMAVRSLDEHGTTMDVVDIVNELRRRGVQFPVLLRFQDVLRAQVRRVNEAFRSATAESNYGNVYRGIYPIKVNQLHEVVDELLDAGRPYGMGLECGPDCDDFQPNIVESTSCSTSWPAQMSRPAPPRTSEAIASRARRSSPRVESRATAARRLSSS